MSVGYSEVLDLNTKEWSIIPEMPKPTILLNMVIKKDKIYMFGGYDEVN